MKLVNIHNKNRKIYLFLRNDKKELEIKEINNFFPYYYEINSEGSFKSFDGKILKKIFTIRPSEVSKSRSDNAYEGDILFTRRYMIDKVKKLEKCPVKIASIDIEITAPELPNPNDPKYPISCISVGNSFTRKIKTFWIKNYETEFKMIEAFIKHMQEEKYDLWLSWNVAFDYNYLYNRVPDFAEKVSPINQSRYGNGEIDYPAGISIVDYLQWFKKVTLNREESYALDYIAQKHLGEKEWGKTEFNVVNERIKEKNINDIRRMIKIEEKFKIVEFFDEIRRLSKVEFEDMIWNSRVWDMLLLQEAKNQNIVLPMKPAEQRGTLEEKVEFKGAYRKVLNGGLHFGCSKYDLASAYPSVIIDFCLDPSNIRKTKEENCIEINGTYFKQDSNAILPIAVKKVIEMKNNIKKKLQNTPVKSKEHEDLNILYKAIKSIANSGFGIFGNRFFRMYSPEVAGTITYLVRDLLKYIISELKKGGYETLYTDTDSVIIETTDSVTDLLNNLIKSWAKKYRKETLNTEFSWEGNFKNLLILALCRYEGELIKPNGETELERVGLEIKRKDSTRYMKEFLATLLNKIREKENKDNIINWIKSEIKNLPNQPLENIAFPCKLARKPEDYKNVPIFLRALNYAQDSNPEFKKPIGEKYFYIYTKPFGYEKRQEQILKLNGRKLTDSKLKPYWKEKYDEEVLVKNMNEDKKETLIQELLEKDVLEIDTRTIKGKEKNVIAFDKETQSHIDKKNIDWKLMTQRNIFNKLEVIFEAMKWDMSQIIGKKSDITPQNTSKETKDEVAEYIKKTKKCEHSVTGSTLDNQSKREGSSPSVRSKFEEIQQEKSQVKEIKNFDLKDLQMRQIKFKEAKKYIVENHYSHTIASSVRVGLGFYYKDKLATAVVYGCPVGRRVTQWLEVDGDNCLELIRLFSEDNLPKNTESYCIGQSFKYLKENYPQYKYIISYSDPNHGHVGYIYQATNWRYVGKQRRLLPERRIFIDGKEVHTRTLNAKHGSSSKKKLKEIYGDRLEIKSALKKYVYLMCLGNKKERREWYKKFPEKPYPKI